MPSGLISPRTRASALADMGERSAFVAGQRVGRPRRARPRRRARLRRLLGSVLATMAITAAGGAGPEAVAPPMPVISGLCADELASMRTAPGPKARAAIGVIRALLRSGNWLTAEISEIDMSRREGPVLYTVDGVEVRLGTEDWDERLVRLEGLLAQIATQDVRTVDLRFRDQVVFQRSSTR